jgi:hypothetical protein
MERPGFRSLHLSLLTGTGGYWEGFQSGLFRQAMSPAKELNHVHLSTTFDNGSSSTMKDPPIHLEEFLPVNNGVTCLTWRSLVLSLILRS